MSTKKIKISGTVLMNTLAQERLRQGLPVFNLGAGEPIVEAFLPIGQAAIHAIKKAKTLYPEVAGLPELRKTTALWLNS